MGWSQCEDERITQWLGALPVTTDQRSLRDRTPALVPASHIPALLAIMHESALALKSPLTVGMVGCLQVGTLTAGWSTARRGTKFEMVMPMHTVFPGGWHTRLSPWAQFAAATFGCLLSQHGANGLWKEISSVTPRSQSGFSMPSALCLQTLPNLPPSRSETICSFCRHDYWPTLPPAQTASAQRCAH